MTRNRTSVVTLLIVITLMFVSAFTGYLLGKRQECVAISNQIGIFSSQQEEYNLAYKKGWVYWFSGYGSENNTEYMEYYDMGRKYNTEFESTKDAFTKGYIDGFYFVNKHEPKSNNIVNYEEKIEKAYYQYYAE
ncbi:MAG: hypothetical protein IKM20_00750 [Erysipelotrichales bacterium]|nr:hypothetical protein [Erysipelotrichales bacterium]